MRKILLLSILLGSTLINHAQKPNEKDHDIALHLVKSNQQKLGLSPDDISNLSVQSSYIIQGSDIRMAYMQQTWKGIPVYNKLLVLAFRNGLLVSQAGELASSMESSTGNHSGYPAVKVMEGLKTALLDRQISFANLAEPVQDENTARLVFGKMGIAHENISAELMWMPTGNSKNYHLAWQYFIAPLKSSDYWLVRVNAENNTVTSTENLTVYCNWSSEGHSANEHYQKHSGTAVAANNKINTQSKNYVADNTAGKKNDWQYRPFVVNSAVYRVVRYPAESPLHTGGTPNTHTNPWTWAPGNATTLGWHNTGFADINGTKGNNVLASDDVAGNNDTLGIAISTTALPDLSFNFTPDFTVAPTQTTPVQNQQFYITNLFYWNNLMHDLTYLYGFDEPSGNFQVNNLSRGGLGNDRVNADAQNPGNCNANFATPVDGISGRMQMFLCTNTNPPRDGDADNGVIAHEYAHGISNRLTGGPGNSSCLGNQEQMGEGWSDYFSLMYTQNWASSTAADGFNNPRGIGTYLFGQLPNGNGIRPRPYTTNFAVNPDTYANLPGQAVPHGVGYIWCTMLWEMTWEIIQSAGINPNLFQVTPSITGGNNIALKLVLEGMRLQPCSPGMVQGRNAILRADTLFFGGQYSCAIWRAFARRGLGFGASQGASTSITDGVANFIPGGQAQAFNSNVIAQVEGSDIIYNQNITAICTDVTNFTLTDTLPAHVTYVSGGVYNAGNRTVTYSPVNVAANNTQNFPFTVNINPGSYYAPVVLVNDNVVTSPPALPAIWTATTTNGASFWRTDGARSRTPLYSYFVNNVTTAADVNLRTTNQYLMPTGGSSLGNRLSFWHWYETEGGFDGGLVEISTNGGTTWTDLGPRIIKGGYNGTITGGPAGTRNAFTGTSNGQFINTVIDLNAFAGQNIMIRFRFISDVGTAATGWNIDDITLSSYPVVLMKSNLFNATPAAISNRTTEVEILNVCTPPAITTQPVPDTLCHNESALYSVIATGSGLLYQWEMSSDGGTNWSPIAGATLITFGINNATNALNGRLYRCVIIGTCGTVTSNPVGILVGSQLVHTALNANPSTVCLPSPSLISGSVNGGFAGGAFGNYTHTLTGSGTIVPNAPSGTNNQDASFTVMNAAIGVNNYRFTSTDGFGCTVSNTVTLTTSSPPVITTQPVARVICEGASTTFNVTTTGLNITYQWQLSTNVGTTWSDITGATTNSRVVAGVTLTQSGHQYRCIVSTACGSDTTNAVTLTVTPNPVHQNVSATPNPVCAPGPITLTGTAIGGTLIGGSDVVIASSGTISLAIPDGGAAVTNSITLPSFTFNPATQLKVRLNIAHTWVGDINIRLTTPCGNTIIFDRPGVPATTLGNSANLSGVYIFDLSAATILNEVSPPTVIPAGSYIPSDVAGAAHNWAGLTFPCTGAGTWTITLQDFAGGDIGTLTEWAILGPSAVGQYSHTLSGTGTIMQNPSSGGPSNPTGNFTVSNLTAGSQTYNLTSADSRGCSVTSPVIVTVNPRPVTVIVPSTVDVCSGSTAQLMVLDTTRVINSTGSVITIPSVGAATPYPSVIAASGLPATARVVAITINGFTHTFPNDVDMLLQSPNGTNVILMSDVGGGGPGPVNANYTFRDGFPAVPTTNPPSGTYRPTNTAGPDNFPAPGPGSITQVNPTLATFNTASLTPNGNWRLFVVDDLAGDQGSIASWSITFAVPGATSINYTWTSAPSGFNGTGNPVSVSPTVNTTYTVNAVSNAGCASVSPGTATVNVLALPAITTQPSPATQAICPGYNVTYTVGATGAGLTYQWRKDGVNLANGPGIAGVTTNTLVLTAVTAASAGTYTVVVSGTCAPSVTSNGAVLQIGNNPTITTQPAAATAICERQAAAISVVATAIPPIQIYQWQVSTDGGTTWTNLANSAAGASPFYNNVFSATLTISNTPLSINNNRYRCVITTNCGFTVNSNASVVTVNATPVVTATPVTARVCLSDTLVLLSGTPAGGVWSGSGVRPTTNQFIPYNTAVGTFPIKYKVTNQPSGCADSATINIRVESCPERIRQLSDNGVLLYPNPNNGQFNIRVNSTLYNYLGMRVFTSAGALVKQQRWSNLPYGRVLPIDIRDLAAGVYMVYIFYEDGVLTSEKTFKVIIPAH